MRIVLRRTHTLGISIHAARVGSNIYQQGLVGFADISIHAAHEGCDAVWLDDVANGKISIHAAHEGCDRCRQTSDF